MKKLLSLLSLTFICLALGAQDQSALAQRIIDASAGMASINCDFTQTRHLSIMNQDIVSKGKMSYSKPDKLRWEYQSPQQMAFVMDGQDVSFENNGKKAQADAVQGGMMYRQIAKLLMSCISGKMLSDQKSFGISINEQGKEIVAELIPKKGELKRMWSKMVMHFDSSSLNAVKIEIMEAGGDSTVIDFYNTKTQRL